MRITSEDRKNGIVKCTRCNGTGVNENEVYLCDKCHGDGKLDWASNAFNKPVHMSSLRLVNVRRATCKIRRIAETSFPNVNHIITNIQSYLDLLKSNYVINDYFIQNYKDNAIQVIIKPSRSVEMVKVDLLINVDGTT